MDDEVWMDQVEQQTARKSCEDCQLSTVKSCAGGYIAQTPIFLSTSASAFLSFVPLFFVVVFALSNMCDY